MHPCQLQTQTETSRARSAHPVRNSKDVSDDVFKRNTLEEPTAAVCAECPVSRERDELILKIFGFREAADKRLASFTNRQYEIMKMVLAGQLSKNIAADLHISRRTVENHRQSIMKRSGVRSLPELARLALAADWTKPIDAVAPENAGPGN
jgi:DNA-binding NarL/FixJ family response regulator